MQTQLNPSVQYARPLPNGGKAIAGFVLGLVAIIAWLVPIIGFPITIVGLIFSALGLSSNHRGMAITGLVLNLLFLIITAANSAIGAYMGYNGTLFH